MFLWLLALLVALGAPADRVERLLARGDPEAAIVMAEELLLDHPRDEALRAVLARAWTARTQEVLLVLEGLPVEEALATSEVYLNEAYGTPGIGPMEHRVRDLALASALATGDAASLHAWLSTWGDAPEAPEVRRRLLEGWARLTPSGQLHWEPSGGVQPELQCLGPTGQRSDLRDALTQVAPEPVVDQLIAALGPVPVGDGLAQIAPELLSRRLPGTTGYSVVWPTGDSSPAVLDLLVVPVWDAQTEALVLLAEDERGCHALLGGGPLSVPCPDGEAHPASIAGADEDGFLWAGEVANRSLALVQVGEVQQLLEVGRAEPVLVGNLAVHDQIEQGLWMRTGDEGLSLVHGAGEVRVPVVQGSVFRGEAYSFNSTLGEIAWIEWEQGAGAAYVVRADLAGGRRLSVRETEYPGSCRDTKSSVLLDDAALVVHNQGVYCDDASLDIFWRINTRTGATEVLPWQTGLEQVRGPPAISVTAADGRRTVAMDSGLWLAEAGREPVLLNDLSGVGPSPCPESSQLCHRSRRVTTGWFGEDVWLGVQVTSQMEASDPNNFSNAPDPEWMTSTSEHAFLTTPTGYPWLRIGSRPGHLHRVAATMGPQGELLVYDGSSRSRVLVRPDGSTLKPPSGMEYLGWAEVDLPLWLALQGGGGKD